MANATIHLAIAKQYLEKNPATINYQDFIAGSLYPDAAEDNIKTHYTNQNRGEDLLSRLSGRVNLLAFLEEHKNLSDFELGWFLHLTADYLFFNDFFEKSYLEKATYQEFCKDLYFAYDRLNNYLTEKYHITKEDYQAYPNQYYPGLPYEDCLLKPIEVDSFINRISSIDLPKYMKKIKTFKINIKPE